MSLDDLLSYIEAYSNAFQYRWFLKSSTENFKIFLKSVSCEVGHMLKMKHNLYLLRQAWTTLNGHFYQNLRFHLVSQFRPAYKYEYSIPEKKVQKRPGSYIRDDEIPKWLNWFWPAWSILLDLLIIRIDNLGFWADYFLLL